MRRALPMLAAIALAGCQVEVEGARCREPGSTADCPDGQACGNDGRCSERAAACAAAGTMCLPTAAPRCRAAAAIERCSIGPDSVCGSWVISTADEDCAARALECREATAGEPACVCRTPAQFIHADPTAPSGPLAPTGADAPPECRFAKLGEAIAYANDVWRPAHGGAPATVRAIGTPGPGAPVVFGAESLPLVIPSGVTLSTVAASPNPSDWEISADPNASVDVVEVHDGAVIEGFTLRNVSATRSGIAVSCGSVTPPTIRGVIIDGAGELARGISVQGACGALLERVDVSRAKAAGLHIAATAANAPVTVKGSRFHDSAIGIQATGGTLLLQPDDATSAPTEVADNTGTGILLTGMSQEVNATLIGVRVARNDGTGIVVSTVPSTSRLTMTSCDIHSNGVATPTQYGPVASRRTAGGILLSQSALQTFQLTGNDIHANHGQASATDEVAFDSSGAWPLGAEACASANRIGCVAATGYAVYATGGTVDASYSYWFPYPPAVTANVSSTENYCGVWSVPCP